MASHGVEVAGTAEPGTCLPASHSQSEAAVAPKPLGRNPSLRREGPRRAPQNPGQTAYFNPSNKAPWPPTRPAADGSHPALPTAPGLTLGVQCTVEQGQESRLPEGVAAVHQLVAAALKSTFKPHLPACHPLLSVRQRRERQL